MNMVQAKKLATEAFHSTAIFLLAVSSSFPQTTTPLPYFYEVASVKSNPKGTYADHVNQGQFGATYISLYSLIRLAFVNLKKYQFVIPAWTETERYDVIGKVPPGATPAQRSAMLQNLLIERFHLAYHFESRDLNVFDLVVAKGGTKMQPAHANEKADPEAPPKVTFGLDRLPILAPDSPPRSLITGLGGQTALVTNKSSMAKLAEFLSSQLDTHVYDRTGLNESYSFLLHFLPTHQAATPPSVRALSDSSGAPDAPQAIDAVEAIPTLFAAVQSQLGLRLDRRKAAVEVLVVDRVEKTPIEN